MRVDDFDDLQETTTVDASTISIVQVCSGAGLLGIMVRCQCGTNPWVLFSPRHPPSQPPLSLDKEPLTSEKPPRRSKPPKKKPKQVEEEELSDSDDYGDFADKDTDFTGAVGDETSSAVESIQQVCPCVLSGVDVIQSDTCSLIRLQYQAGRQCVAQKVDMSLALWAVA